MSRRNEVSRWALNRDWPHQVEMSATLVRGSLDEIHAFLAARSSAASRSTWVRRFDRDWIRFPFAAPDDADAFQLRFGGRRVTVNLVKNRQVDDWGPLGAPEELRCEATSARRCNARGVEHL